MNDQLSLPSRFDSASVREIAAALLQQRSQPVTLEGSRVSVAGALAIQALVAGQRQWREDGVAFCVVSPSETLLETCALLGVAPAEIGVEDVTGEDVTGEAVQ
ncbi:MAG: STAS domain-containing protein [Roseovarius sp.]